MARRTKEQAEATRQQIIAAAGKVFHRHGVSGSSLEMVAQEAGLTRGALYWHFKDKAQIFLALRESVLQPILAEIELLFVSGRHADPLDYIEAALRRFFRILEDRPGVRMVLETISFRCEHVAEFAAVQSDFEWSLMDFLTRLEGVYCEAAALGTLRTGLLPGFVARDTWAFFCGLVNRLLLGDANGKFRAQVFEMISFHMALRRCGDLSVRRHLKFPAGHRDIFNTMGVLHRPKELPVPELTAAQQRLHQAALQLFAKRGVAQINVSELAQAAGMARGTVYNNLADLDGLFATVANQLSSEMSERIADSVRGLSDPAHRLANGIRFFVRRAHEEPHWGRFICRFALSDAALQEIWAGQPAKDLQEGLEGGRFGFQREQLTSVIGLLAGTVLGAIFLVLEGQKTWREAGSDAAELFLVAAGVARHEARVLAGADLPALPLSEVSR